MDYFKEIKQLFSDIQVNDNNARAISLDRALSKIISLIELLDRKNNKLIFIGNGGSAAIANHITTDLVKNVGIPAFSFSDASLITCLSNDLGYEYVFQKPIEVLAKKNDILFSISSSGMSKNILNATIAAKQKGCFLVTLSGFNKKNTLRSLGQINFYVPSNSYGYVEIAHLAICHCIVDNLLGKKK